MKSETDLSFIEKYSAKPKPGLWTLKRAKALVRLCRADKKPKFIASYLKIKEVSVTNMISELKRAAKKKYTLEKYFEKNRPCAVGKKVLA